MATLTISLASTPLTGAKSYTLSDADAATFIAWVQFAYQGPPDAQGNPTTLTPAQALVAWANGIVGGTVNNVARWQKDQATATATAAVKNIGIA